MDVFIDSEMNILLNCSYFFIISRTNRSSPSALVTFQFDQSLIEDKDTLGKLQPNTLTVDNLTVQWLRTRLTELEVSVKECQEKLAKIQIDNGSHPPISVQSILTNGNVRKENSKYVTMKLNVEYKITYYIFVIVFSKKGIQRI